MYPNQVLQYKCNKMLATIFACVNRTFHNSIYIVQTYCKHSNISQDKSTNDFTTFAEVFEYLGSLDYSTK